jgi:aconitate hydratase
MSAVPASLDTFKSRSILKVGDKSYAYFSLPEAERNGLAGLGELPLSLKVLIENLLRHEDGRSVKADDIRAVVEWLKARSSTREVAYRPARVLMQDFTGVPAVVDLAAMRDAMKGLGGDPSRINPLVPVDLVIDHSVQVDFFGSPDAFKKNVEIEYERNKERYEFLRWGAGAFDNFRVVPPGTGICHQVNLEYLAQTVWTRRGRTEEAFPDTCVGTDSHTTMVNALGVLGWGVGGIEAEAAMLGQPVAMVIPEVVGFGFKGRLREGVTATDLVLTCTQMLRKRGVVEKFVEFFGDGLDHLSVEDRATIANMAPEYGATCGYFPVDADTIKYLRATGRATDRVALVEAYCKAQGLWRAGGARPAFTDTLELDLASVEPSLAGPKRPQDRVPLAQVKSGFAAALPEIVRGADIKRRVSVAGADYDLGHGDVVIAAITSCTNTSNPSVLIAAGLLARNAHARGLKAKPWVKTSLAPGSQVVTDYLAKAGLQRDLDALGFNLAGYGCTTCIGNSGPLADDIAEAVRSADLVVGAVLSGNRNFEGRVNADVKANYLASPPLVVAYALCGTLNKDLATEPLGEGADRRPVYLKDIWPTSAEVAELIRTCVTPDLFAARYGAVFEGDAKWRAMGKAKPSLTYRWSSGSTYVQHPPYFEGLEAKPVPISDVVDARVLGLFLDSITTDHISPAGSIKKEGPAGVYLIEHQVRPSEFNSYGARRGNHNVMMRGTFANVRIKNIMMGGKEGGVTIHYPSGDAMSIFEAAMRYKAEGVSLVVFAGREYGTGSSRDWAAKGTRLLGVRAVIAQSFERIHRSNLVGMGVLPLVFKEGQSWQGLGLTGKETISIGGLAALKPRQTLKVNIASGDGKSLDIEVLCRIDTEEELSYFRNGGILPFVLRNLASAA